MMTIKDYAQDVDKTVEEIEALCDKIGIDYQDENTDLDETSIILLDNEAQEMEQNCDSEVVDEETEERRLEEEVKDKAEELAYGTKIDLDEEIQETTSTPVSGKVIVVDAGHGVPDERC